MLPDEVDARLTAWASEQALIDRLWIFGSRARADFRPDSDLDIAIALDPTLCLGDDSGGSATWMFETEQWKEQLGALIPFAIDLNQFVETSPIIVTGVAQSSRLVYRKSKPQ